MSHVSPLLVLAAIAASAFGGPAEAVSAAAADVAGRPAIEQPQCRYLYLGHLDTPKERQEWWQRVASHAASTSRKARIYRPAVILLPVKPGGPMEEGDGLVIVKPDWGRAILIRLNLAHQGYERDVWEKIALVEPHFHFRERDQQRAKIVVNVPAIVQPVVPVVEEPDPRADLPRAVYVERGGRLGEVGIESVSEGETVWIRGQGGRLVRMTMPARKAKAKAAEKPKAEDKDKKEEAKKVEKVEETFYGKWAGKDIGVLALATNSYSPIAYADWYWWQVSIQTEREPGPGYYDLLGIKDEKTFDELVGFDGVLFKARFAEFVKEYRAAVSISGISKQPRRIAVEDKLGGEKWFSFDNILAKGERNPIDTPNGGFRYNASEQMAHLPNGFLAQGLFAEDGTKQDSAPDNVVGSDRTSTNIGDGRIHAGLCFRCHTNGMQPVDDWFSDRYKPPNRLAGPDLKKIEDIQEKYFGRLQEKLKLSVDRHASAVRESCGLTLPEYSKLLGSGWLQVEDSHVDLKRAAREFGVPALRLQQAIAAYKTSGKYNGASMLDMFGDDEKKQKPIPVRQFWECITEGHVILAAFKEGKP